MLEDSLVEGQRDDAGPFSENENNGKKNKSIAIKILGFFVVLFFVCLFSFNILKPKAKGNTVYLERGTALSRNVQDYLQGFSFMLKMTEGNFEAIDIDTTGNYELDMCCALYRYKFEVVVQDTTPPELITIDNKVVKVGEEYSPDTFIYDSRSLCSGKETYSFSADSTQENTEIIGDGEKIIFDATGEYVFNIVAKDEFDNISMYEITAFAECAPEIDADFEEFYVALGTGADFCRAVKVTDYEDGVLDGSHIKATIDGKYLKESGDYTVTLCANDSFDITSEKEYPVHVYEPLILQDLVNTGKIEGKGSNVFGCENPYDAGYLPKGDIQKAIENTKEALVSIYYTDQYSITNGSGFVLKIDDSEVIICTNRHVVEGRREVYVTFFDKSVSVAKVRGSYETPDIAFISIDTSLLSKEVRENLKTVHINGCYFDNITNNPNFTMGLYCIDPKGNYWYDSKGKIVTKDGTMSVYFEGYDYRLTQMSLDLIPGVSGSAVLDEYGNLICMATFYWKNGYNIKENYGVKVDDILNYYELTFGERLEYY